MSAPSLWPMTTRTSRGTAVRTCLATLGRQMKARRTAASGTRTSTQPSQRRSPCPPGAAEKTAAQLAQSPQ
eukprot:4871296-Pleurochrysis_carterae.AAC.1